MQLKVGTVLTQSGDMSVLVATGEAGKAFSGMIKLNSSAAFIAEKLKNDTDEDKIIAALLEKYDVTPEHAAESVMAVIAKLEGVGLIER